jgi:hypothetical protein
LKENSAIRDTKKINIFIAIPINRNNPNCTDLVAGFVQLCFHHALRARRKPNCCTLASLLVAYSEDFFDFFSENSLQIEK